MLLKRAIPVLLILSFITLVYSDSGNANQFLDEILENVKSVYREELLKISLPDHRKKTWVYTATLLRGRIERVDDIVRVGEATLSEGASGTYTLRARLSVRQIHAAILFRVKTMWITNSSTFRAKFDELDVNLVAEVNLDPNVMTFSVKEATLIHESGFHMKASNGFGQFLKWIADTFSGVNFKNVIVDKIRDVLNSKVKISGSLAKLIA